MKNKLFLTLIIILIGVIHSDAQVSGIVFRDYNSNGTKDSTATFIENGIGGVTVTAYDVSGASAGSITTAADGTYTIPLLTGMFRIEFTNLQTGDYTSFAGGTSVQFVTAPIANINFAINNPSDYNTGQANASLSVPRQFSGDPLGGGSAGSSTWFLGYPYTYDGNVIDPPMQLKGDTVGSLWGVAYSRQAGKIFTSAYMKRHVGFGRLGSGGIYLLTPTTTSYNVNQFFDMDNNTFNTAGTPITRTRFAGTSPSYGELSSYNITNSFQAVTYNGANDPISGSPAGLGVLGTNVQRGLSPNVSIASYDPAAFDQVGKVGIGDIDISDDGKYLFVTNLYSKKIFRLTLDNPYNPTSVIAITSYDLPNIIAVNGVLRPFGLKFYREKLYVGAVATGENESTTTNANLIGYVFTLDNPTSSASFNPTPVLNIPLNYVKGSANSIFGPDANRWHPWTNDFADFMTGYSYTIAAWTQPILSDIEFNERGDMILSFTDRGGNQIGHNSYMFLSTLTIQGTYHQGGDVLIAGYNPQSNVYTLENNGTYNSNGTSYSSGVANNQGPGNSEFFKYEDLGGHQELAMGSSAYLKGSFHTVQTAMDPTGVWEGGTLKFSINDATRKGAYRLYFDEPGTFSKGVGLGDIELITPLPPIEIGNRVWNDTDGDGVQDAGENPIQGVTVELVKSGSVIATATTDATGNYYFSNAVGINTLSHIYGISQLMPNMEYTVRIPNVQGGSKQSVLGINNLTTANVGGSGQPDARDSDGSLVGNNAEVTVLTTDIPTEGANNHTFDFGFSPVLTCSISLTATPGTCNPANNQYSVTGNITFTNPPATGTLTVSVGAVTQVFNAPFTSPQAYTLSGLTSDGSSHTVTAVFSADGTCTSSVTYTAPVNCTPNSCSISLTATPGTCNSANNQYSITGSITFANAPTTGTLTVSVGAVSQTFNAPFTSPQPYTLSGLTSDGSSHTVTAIFSADGSCTSSVTYTAPSACGCNNTPYPLCPGESYTMTAQSGYQNYQWYTVSGTTETQISGATNQTYTVTATGIYKWKATDGNNCPVEACCQYEFVALNCIVCDITNVGLSISNCDNKGTLTNSNDDEYTFTLNPTGTDLGTTYTVTGLPNSPQTGTYGSPTTFGPYLISGGILNITVSDNTSTSCSQTATVAPPASCSSCNVSPPVLVVTDNICPSRTGAINVVQGCGSGSFIQYSVNNGNTWSTIKPIYSTSPITIMTRCVYSLDTVCKSAIATVSTNPNKCPSNSNDCSLVANSTINPCNDNGTDNIVADDYFTIQINANVTNGGSFGKYEVVFGADPNTGAGGNVLNSGGTTYGSPITIGGNKIFLANGISTYQLVVRDINNNTCYQLINIPAVNPCSTAPPKSPCYPVPCVPIGVIKN